MKPGINRSEKKNVVEFFRRRIARFSLMFAIILAGVMAQGNTARAQQTGFLGEVKLFAGNFAPLGWAFCNGQTLSLEQNSALFSILGTTYGGNGITTFNLPDLRGRVPVSQGQGPGLSNYVLGQTGGSETTTLTVGNLPSHTHTVSIKADSSVGSSDTPAGKVPARNAAAVPQYSSNTTGLVDMNAQTVSVGSTGSGQPFNNVQPYLGLNYIICIEGVFPSRN